ncbi:hypothetical protein [Luethyella okanaganae]|uniref:DUF559 domain-containing protein n=1 Tax=Luethyella okanaganae TaxID=69372 RepID=A0ABW1VEF2_9MICO
MRKRRPIPDHLRGRPIAARDAASVGLTESLWRGPGLARPFHGVRIAHDAELSVRELIEAYSRRMPPAQFFSHTSAALLYGMPLPTRLERSSLIHVSAEPGGAIPRARGVIGHHAAWDRTPTTLGALRASSPLDTWCELSTILELDDLVAVGDFIVTGDEPFSGHPPLSCLDDMGAAVTAHGRRRGARSLSAALRLVRYGPLSRMETITRLFVVRAGLPEPSINYRVCDTHGRPVSMVDLAFVDWKVAVEYQGDHHREKGRFRDDIARRERLEDLGWTVVYISIDDMGLRPAETIARLRTRLRSRGAPL